MYLALINNYIVEAVVIGDESFVEHVKNEYDYVLDVSNDQRPEVGDSYYPQTNNFVSNSVYIHEISVDLEAEHMKNGTEDGFEPFCLTDYSVKYEDGNVIIGCKAYSAAGLFDSLHKTLIEKKEVTSIFAVLDGVPGHGKFRMSWEDANKLYEVLSKVKFI